MLENIVHGLEQGIEYCKRSTKTLSCVGLCLIAGCFGDGSQKSSSATKIPIIIPNNTASSQNANEAVESRLSTGAAYLTKLGNNSQYTAESDYLLKTEPYKSELANTLTTGTDSHGNPAPPASTWQVLFSYWTNGIVGLSPDDEISNTIADNWGTSIDMTNNVVSFYLDTVNGPMIVRTYLTSAAMTYLLDKAIKPALADVYVKNGNVFKPQTEFDPSQ